MSPASMADCCAPSERHVFGGHVTQGYRPLEAESAIANSRRDVRPTVVGPALRLEVGPSSDSDMKKQDGPNQNSDPQ